MKPRSVLIMLAVVAGLIAFVGLYEKDLPSNEERAELERKIFRQPKSEIRTVTLRKGDEGVVLSRDSGGEPISEEDSADQDDAAWMIVEPIQARADQALVDSLLTSLVSMEKTRTLEGMTLAEAGLEPPRGSVAVEFGDRGSEVQLGSEIPASLTMIVRMENTGEVAVVDSAIWSQVTRSPGDWRARNMIDAAASEIERVELVFEGRTVELSRRDEGAFWLEGSTPDRASEDQVGDLLTDITGLYAYAFVDDPSAEPSALGLEPPAGVIEVRIDEATEPILIEMGSAVNDTENRVYVRVGDQIFEAESDLTVSLARPEGDWRSRELTSMETFQIDRVEIRGTAHGEMILERAGADWLRDGEEISFTTVSDLLYAIVDAKAEQLGDPNGGVAPGSDPADVELVIIGEDAAQTLRIYQTADTELVPVTVEDRKIVLLINRDTLANVEEKIAEVRSVESRAVEDEVNEADAGSEETSIPD